MKPSEPSSISFECPSGHKLRAAGGLAGRTGKCPACSQPATVPQPSAPLSETGAFRILSECTAVAAPKSEPVLRPKPQPTCPRCHEVLLAGASICCHCRLRLRDDDRLWKRAERAALRSVHRPRS